MRFSLKLAKNLETSTSSLSLWNICCSYPFETSSLCKKIETLGICHKNGLNGIIILKVDCLNTCCLGTNNWYLVSIETKGIAFLRDNHDIIHLNWGDCDNTITSILEFSVFNRLRLVGTPWGKFLAFETFNLTKFSGC